MYVEHKPSILVTFVCLFFASIESILFDLAQLKRIVQSLQTNYELVPI